MKYFLLPFFTILFSLLSGAATAEEIQLEHRGLTLNADLSAIKTDWQRGPVVLLVHGTVGHNAMPIMAGLQETLHAQGITSLAITLSLGVDDRHGRYDCATPHRHRHTGSIEEIGLWVDWLKDQGAEDIVMLGHSRGANQVAWYAAGHDDPAIGKVVLIAPPVWTPESVAKRYQDRYGENMQSVLERAKALVKKGEGDTLLEHIPFLNCADAPVSAATFVDYYPDDARFDTTTLLPGIGRPVLVFAGSDDQVVPNLGDRLAPLAEQDTIELEVIEGAGHMFKGRYTRLIAEKVGRYIWL